MANQSLSTISIDELVTATGGCLTSPPATIDTCGGRAGDFARSKCGTVIDEDFGRPKCGANVGDIVGIGRPKCGGDTSGDIPQPCGPLY